MRLGYTTIALWIQSINLFHEHQFDSRQQQNGYLSIKWLQDKSYFKMSTYIAFK